MRWFWSIWPNICSDYTEFIVYPIARDRNFIPIYPKSVKCDDISTKFDDPDQKMCPLYLKSDISVFVISAVYCTTFPNNRHCGELDNAVCGLLTRKPELSDRTAITAIDGQFRIHLSMWLIQLATGALDMWIYGWRRHSSCEILPWGMDSGVAEARGIEVVEGWRNRCKGRRKIASKTKKNRIQFAICCSGGKARCIG